MNYTKWGISFYVFTIGTIVFLSGIIFEATTWPGSKLFDAEGLQWLSACFISSIILSFIFTTKNVKALNYLFAILSIGTLGYGYYAYLTGAPDGAALFIPISMFAVIIPVYIISLVGIKILNFFESTQNKFIRIVIFIIPLISAPIAGYFFGGF